MPMDSNIPPTTPTSSPQNFDTSVSTDKLTDTQPLMAASGTQIRENYDMIAGDPLSTASLKAQEAIERTAQKTGRAARGPHHGNGQNDPRERRRTRNSKYRSHP